MKPTSVGRRNCLCKLMSPTGGERDSRGHQTEEPKEIGKFWCKIEQLAASESLIENQLYASKTLLLTTTWVRSITPTPAMWFEYQDRKLEIIGIENVEERNIEWRFTCSEQVKVRKSDV